MEEDFPEKDQGNPSPSSLRNHKKPMAVTVSALILPPACIFLICCVKNTSGCQSMSSRHPGANNVLDQTKRYFPGFWKFHYKLSVKTCFKANLLPFPLQVESILKLYSPESEIKEGPGCNFVWCWVLESCIWLVIYWYFVLAVQLVHQPRSAVFALLWKPIVWCGFLMPCRTWN